MSSPPDRREPQGMGGDSSSTRKVSLEVGLLLLAIGLLHVITLVGVSRYGLAVLFVPAVFLLLPVLGLRIFSQPVRVYALYLLIIVNLNFFRIRDTPLTADIITSVMLLYAVLVRFILEGRGKVEGPISKTFLIYMGATFLSVVLSVSPATSLKNWGRELQYLVFYLFLVSVPLTRVDRRLLLGAVIYSSVIPCVLGLAGQVFGIEQFYGQETPIAGGEAVKRIQSTLSHPVVFSQYLSFVAIITLSAIVLGKWFRRLHLVPIFILQLALLYLTFGRTGWVQLLVSLIALFWFLGMRRVVFIVLPGLAAGLLAVLPSLLGRIQNAFEAGDNSLIWRLGLWAYALTKFPQRPFFGSGPATFPEYVAFGTGFAAHQTWIGLLIETGIMGLGTFLVLQIAIGRTLTRLRRDPVRARDPIILGVSAGWVGLLVASFTGTPFNLPAVAIYFWTLLALAVKFQGSRT